MQLKHKELIKQIGQRFRRVRLDMDLSLKEIAETLGIQTSGYRKNELGINAPGLSTLEKMLKKHGISLNWLLFNSGPMRIETHPAPAAKPETKTGPEPAAETQTPPMNPLDADTKELMEAMDRDRGLQYEILAHYYRYRENRNPAPPTPTNETPVPENTKE